MRAVRGLFVTGTDTGVGKTTVTAGLAAALREDGSNIGVWKPVQTGVYPGSGESDAERLIRGSGLNERPETIAPFTFEAPLAPMIAAKKAGFRLSLEELEKAGEPLVERYDALLVEGAGGIAVPLTDEALVVDWIARLGLPVLIVARSGLRTINHTLLTLAMLRQYGIVIAGIILNDGTSEPDPSCEDNAALIEQYGKVKVLGRFPCLHGEPTLAKLSALTRQAVDVMKIRFLLFED